MKHTICFIDDKIPASQYMQYFEVTDIINESGLKFLLQNADWQDDLVIRNLCETLIQDRNNWSISAFVNPNFYIKYISETVYAPDVVIYDWDYPGLQDDSENVLFKILNETPTLVFIFSQNDNIEQIETLFRTEDKFAPFSGRLVVIDKSAKDSVNSIFSKIQEKDTANFSFAYGGQIIRKSNQIINKILSDISQLSTEGFIAAIGKEENNKYMSSTNDFVDVIIPRYRNALYSVPGNDGDIITIDKSRDIDIREIKKIWSYKMYEKNDSNIVALGDIIHSEENYYLVISSDCHMQRFWEKNGGYMAVIPLEKLTEGEKNKQVKYLAERNSSITSLTSYSKALSILPAVPVGEQLIDFLVLPKRISTIQVEKVENRPQILTYDFLNGYEKIASISDPFKSPLFHFIMNRISDLGCPDFPTTLQNHISELINQAR